MNTMGASWVTRYPVMSSEDSTLTGLRPLHSLPKAKIVIYSNSDFVCAAPCAHGATHEVATCTCSCRVLFTSYRPQPCVAEEALF